MRKTCSKENLRYPLLQDFTMFTHFKKLLKKSLRLNDRHSFDEKKTRAPSNETKNEAKERSKNTNNTEPDQRKDTHSNPQGSDPVFVLYKFDACPYCKRVQRKIDELRISDKIEMRDTRTEPKWRKDLKNRTGRTQVPCLFIDGTPMFESLDIIEFLQTQFTIDS